MATKKGPEKSHMTRQEAGHLGGEARKEEMVSEAYAKMGRKGGEAVSQDRQHMAEIGRQGGLAHGAGGSSGASGEEPTRSSQER